MSRSSLIDTADAFGGVLVRDDGKDPAARAEGPLRRLCVDLSQGTRRMRARCAREAALREVHEETGYRARITGRLPVVCSLAIPLRRYSF